MSSGATGKLVVHKNAEQDSYGEQHAAGKFAAATAHALPFLSENINANYGFDEVQVLGTGAGITVGSNTSVDVVAPFQCALTYKDLDVLWACALGFEHPDDSPAFEDPVYRHVYEVDRSIHATPWQCEDDREASSDWLAGDTKNRAFGIASDKGVSDHAADSAMISSFTLRTGIGNTTVSFDTVAQKIRNANLSADSWVALSSSVRAIFTQLTVSIGSLDETTYPDAEISIADLELTFNNNLQTGLRGTTTGVYTMEPVRNGFVSLSGSITLPRYVDDDIINVMSAGKNMRMSIVFSSGNYTVGFFVPRLVFRAGDTATDGPTARSPKFDFTGYAAPALTSNENGFKDGSAANWYAGYLGGIPIIKNGPLVIVTKSDETSNLLLEAG